MNKPGIKNKPEILAPAGSRVSFLAALAAGADAIYCGLKTFSARMEAKNFSIEELAELTHLAHGKGASVYVTLNTMIKPTDVDQVARCLDQLNRFVKPDAIIAQDLAVIGLIHQIGFPGKIHLSTLANVNTPEALRFIKQIPEVSRVVLPRELDIDEIKAMAKACPSGLGVETFIHGALCYAVSGRCYWSSYLGGKSGLRGRCVQPCRRMYTQIDQSRRFFSCQDLSIDVLVKVLLSVPEIKAWKIEGRKKGPHYVYHTVKAYQILRDLADDPENRVIAKKTALGLLTQALGRSATHYNFLPQRPQKPIDVRRQTASGLFVGKVQGAKLSQYVVPRRELFPGDVLRLGYEDETWHAIQRVGKYIPARGRFAFNLPSRKVPKKGTPVFLTDRRESELSRTIETLNRQIEKSSTSALPPSDIKVTVKKKRIKRNKVFTYRVYRDWPARQQKGPAGLWLSSKTLSKASRQQISRSWWWLPPIAWPADEKKFKIILTRAAAKGARRFVLNAPWQRGYFKKDRGLIFWAGPFCNLANSLAMEALDALGFSGAFISPELGSDDIMILPKLSPLPLGIVAGGNWPLCISRVLADDIHEKKPFSSPRGEQSWVRKYESNYWVFPNWLLDLGQMKDKLRKAGYNTFVHVIEPVPRDVKMKKRPGKWNWDIGLN